MSDEGLRAMDAVIRPIIDDDDMPCLDDYRRALAAALNQEERDA